MGHRVIMVEPPGEARSSAQTPRRTNWCGEFHTALRPLGAGCRRAARRSLEPRRSLSTRPSQLAPRLRGHDRDLRGTEESNLEQGFWRPPCYRYTSPPRIAYMQAFRLFSGLRRGSLCTAGLARCVRTASPAVASRGQGYRQRALAAAPRHHSRTTDRTANGNPHRPQREAACDAPSTPAGTWGGASKIASHKDARGLRCARHDTCMCESTFPPEPTTTRLGDAPATSVSEPAHPSQHMPTAPNSTRPSAQPTLLLTRQQAAAALAMSLSHFERYVQPHVPVVRSGQLRLYRPSDLSRWADRHTTTRASA